jgi:2,3-dihydroxy-2,3-dihydrophenylpropionate dehydrogenase
VSNGAGRVAGKVALITGGGTGIGRAIAVRLVQKGADVVVISRTPEHLEETCDRAEGASGRRPLSFPLDVSARAAVDRVVGQVADRFGRIDVLSNNAGIELPHGSLWRRRPTRSGSSSSA